MRSFVKRGELGRVEVDSEHALATRAHGGGVDPRPIPSRFALLSLRFPVQPFHLLPLLVAAIQCVVMLAGTRFSGKGAEIALPASVTCAAHALTCVRLA